MGQELKNTPRTRQETERQKGPLPLVGIALAAGLAIALILFLGPPFVALIRGE